MCAAQPAPQPHGRAGPRSRHAVFYKNKKTTSEREK
jgi:hypothetical protein